MRKFLCFSKTVPGRSTSNVFLKEKSCICMTALWISCRKPNNQSIKKIFITIHSQPIKHIPLAYTRVSVALFLWRTLFQKCVPNAGLTGLTTPLFIPHNVLTISTTKFQIITATNTLKKLQIEVQINHCKEKLVNPYNITPLNTRKI